MQCMYLHYTIHPVLTIYFPSFMGLSSHFFVPQKNHPPSYRCAAIRHGARPFHLEPLTSTALRGLRAQPPWPRGWRPRTATAGLGTGGFRVGRGAATPIQTLVGRTGGAERGESGKEELIGSCTFEVFSMILRK